MSVIKLGTNVASLLVQRNLATATFALQTNFERLSSGLRINSAKDDAAGLALAEKLNADARVYTQAILNVNDGISLLNVAEAALNELSSIVTRQIELAEQASNGILTLEQRRPLKQESDALTDEYNRIVATTTFNDIALLQPSVSLDLQAGGNSFDTISLDLGSELAVTVGSGTFGTPLSFGAGLHPWDAVTADFNGDGTLDIALGDRSTGQSLNIFLGNGDGTFDAYVSYDAGVNVGKLDTGDFNGDGVLDVAAVLHGTGSGIGIFWGSSDGTFSAMTSVDYGTGAWSYYVISDDFDNDGTLDLIYTDANSGAVISLHGNGDGTFSRQASYSVGSAHVSTTSLDCNGDGNLDLFVTSLADNFVGIMIGNGNGTFQNYITVADFTAAVNFVTSGDVDGDGLVDVAFMESGANIHVMINNGDGTFKATPTISAGDSGSLVALTDLNADGLLDLMMPNINQDTVSVLLGNGNGTFGVRITYAVGDEPVSPVAGDFNNDGAIDILTSEAAGGSISVILGVAEQRTSAPYLYLMDQEGALESLEIINNTSRRVSAELGNIGAAQSRLAHTVNYLQQIRENYLTAKSQIEDADVALEAAELVRNQILQQAAAAVLAQANQQSSIALLLLGEGI